LIVLDAPAAVSIFLNVGREAGRIRVAEKRTFGALSVRLPHGEVRAAYGLGLRERSYFLRVWVDKDKKRTGGPVRTPALLLYGQRVDP